MNPDTRLRPPGATTTSPQSGARLRFDSGQAFTIGAQLVIGRVGAIGIDVPARASVVCPSGDTAGLSRRHAAIEASGACWTVTDLGSLNGSFIWDRFARRWHRLPPGQRSLIAQGTRLALAWRTCVVEVAAKSRPATPSISL